MRLSEPRIHPLQPSEWTEETREILGRAQPGASGADHVHNIFATLVRHPKLLKRWLVFGAHILTKSTLPAREREIVILRVGWLCRAEYEWAQHVQIGKRAGLTDEEITRIAEGPDAPGWDAFDALLLRATDELHGDAFITDTTWKALTERLGTEQVMDLIFTVGQYNLVSMALNSLGVQLDEGLEGFPKP